jgi:hypothetical protein
MTNHCRMIRSLVSTALCAFVLVGFLAATAGRAAAFQVRPCDKLLDFSGSVTDDGPTRAWSMSTLTTVLQAEKDSGASGAGDFAAYGNVAQLLDVPASSEPRAIVDAVAGSMWTNQWTDPLAGLDLALHAFTSSCLIHITDGTMDLPPDQQGTEADYAEKLLALADQFGREGVRVVTIAESDASGDVWREFATRSGGLYLVLPDAATISAGVESMIVPVTAAPWVAPSAALTPTAPGATAAASGGAGFNWNLWAPLTLIAIAGLGLVFWTVLNQRRPALSGWLESEEDDHD